MPLVRWWYLLLIPAVPVIQVRIDARGGTFKAQEEVLYLWSAQQVRALAPGFQDLLADLYWIRTVQYFGGQRVFAQDKRFDLLYPLVDIATDLDDRLVIAYRYGAIFLCERWPIGKGDPAAGIRILEKGVRALPRDWRLRQDLGYFRYLFLGDAQGAARDLLEAAKVEGSGPWLPSLAAIIFTKSGTDRRTQREIWQRVEEQSEESFLKDSARDNLQRLDGLDAVDALNAAVDRFEAQYRRIPRNVQELIQEGVDRRLLVDPTGVAFLYDANEGSFWFRETSRLWSLLGKTPRRPGRSH